MKIICTLPNCSERLNGPVEGESVQFVPHIKGMISEEVSDEVADYFLSVPGFIKATRGAARPADEEDDQPSNADEDAEIRALVERAKAVNLTIGDRWKLPRLRAEVEKAEAADAALKEHEAQGEKP